MRRRARAARWVLVHACLIAAAGCGDDGGGGGGGTGDGCITDVECKGDRVCEGGVCVDPSGSGGESGSGAGAGAGGGGASGGGSGGTSGSAGQKPGSGGGVIDDPELEKACGLNCEARHAAACSMNIGSLDQCLGQCLIADEVNSGYCLDEQTAQYACLASGGYTCVSGYPQQKATCVSETQALSMCSQKAPCRMFCDRIEGQCAPFGSDCVAGCWTKQNSFMDALCGVYYSQLLACWSQNPSCNGDQPSLTACGAQASQVADCIARRNHECDGYCWMAEALGCGSDICVADCKAKADNTSCGSYYRNLLDCAIGDRELRVMCADGAPKIDTSKCSSYAMQYEACMQ